MVPFTEMEKCEEEADWRKMIKIPALDMLKMSFLFHIHIEMLNLQLDVDSPFAESVCKGTTKKMVLFIP